MFHRLFTASKAVDRHSKGPLLEERLRHLTHCAEQGSTRSSLRPIAQHLLIFADRFNLEAKHIRGRDRLIITSCDGVEFERSEVHSVGAPRVRDKWLWHNNFR
jgi:hypothetical protein